MKLVRGAKREGVQQTYFSRMDAVTVKCSLVFQSGKL